MEISFCSHPNTNKVIATIFGTWHDSWAVVACAKFCCDVVISNWIRAKWNFHRIWIVMEKSLVKWAPGTQYIKCLRKILTLFPTIISTSSCAFFWHSGWSARQYRRKDIPLDVVSKPAKNRMKPWARISFLLSAIINKMVNALILADFYNSKKRLH